MASIIIDKILERINQPDLLHTLSKELSGTELNTLLLEVFSQRTEAMDPPELLSLYQSNRFVKPADLPVLELKGQELDLLALFAKFSFQPIELSPVSVLGSCSVVAPASQNKILSATRGTEVLADATNSIALHCCDLKKQKVNADKEDRLRFGAIQRHIRTQQIEGKGFTPHFKIGCLVTSGSDGGGFSFEKESLLEHLNIMRAVFTTYYKVETLRFRLLCRPGYADAVELANQVRGFILERDSDFSIQIVPQPEKDIAYYKGIQYKVDIEINGRQFEIGDGGFVDWTQKLLQNKKERMLTTGFGFDLMYRMMNQLI